MKRKLCVRPPFDCEDMEELNVAALSQRKESVAPLTGDRDGNIFHRGYSYPLAIVLRLRVLQSALFTPLNVTTAVWVGIASYAIWVSYRIVCGISAMVMGSVAFIEERQKFNMGLGIPAGGMSVLAAAVSIHTSRGWSAATGTLIGASSAGVLWAAAGCLLVALVVQCCRTIIDPLGSDYIDKTVEDDALPPTRDLVVIACVQIALALITLLSVAVCARIDLSE